MSLKVMCCFWKRAAHMLGWKLPRGTLSTIPTAPFLSQKGISCRKDIWDAQQPWRLPSSGCPGAFSALLVANNGSLGCIMEYVKKLCTDTENLMALICPVPSLLSA